MNFRNVLSFGGWVIVLAALLSSLLLALSPTPHRLGLEMWVFARPHYNMYAPIASEWNDGGNSPPLNVYQLSLKAVERRMLSGFMSETPVADLIEVDVNAASGAFTGPLQDVGFVDLTDRIRKAGLDQQLNGPSFSPWTSRGRVFGLPHDVHPVMLAYRADIVEAAGIDVAQIETWDDYVRLLKPLMADKNGDGQPDHYLLNYWQQQFDSMEALLLQAGGGNFDEHENLVINSDINARVISRLATWVVGPNRIAVDAEEWSPAGNRLKIEGRVIGSLMPDWLGGVWKTDMPQLAGKIKLMPIPAWEPGGRRTSVWGGTMLGIARTTQDIDTAWEMAQHLYLNEEMAETLFKSNGIISPVKGLWSRPFYDEPDPFFMGQAPGRMYIELASEVPRRTSSPFNFFAKEQVRDAIAGLVIFADENNAYTVDLLADEAKRLLTLAQETVQDRIDRNVFLQGASQARNDRTGETPE